MFSMINPLIKKDITLATKLLVVESFMLICMAGFRDGIGMDYQAYHDIYNNSNDLEIREPGFNLIMYIFKSLGLSFDYFNFFIAFITLLLTLRFFIRKSPYLFFTILIYFSLGNYYFNIFNAIRQSLAIAIFLNVLLLLENGKSYKSVFILILSSFFFHLTALLLIPLCFILNKKIKFKLQITTLIITIIGYPLVLKIIEISPYAVYLKMEKFSSAVPPTYYLILLFALLILYFSYKDSLWRNNNIIYVNVNFIVLLLLCMLFISNNTPLVMIFHRLLQYFTLIYVILIPKIVYRYNIKSNRLILISVGSFIFAMLCFISIYENGEQNLLIPYKTIFDKYL